MTLATLGPVVLLGAGKMGMAMARGWIDAGLDPAQLILIAPRPSQNILDFCEKTGARVQTELGGEAPRVLLIAVKPQVLPSILPDVKALISSHTLVLSVAAGITLHALEQGVGSGRVVRTMPNTPSQVGKGVTGAVSGSAVCAEDREITDALLRASGAVVWLQSEKDIDALTPISGCGPAYVFLLVEAMAAAGVAQGLPEDQAMLLARETVIGAARLMEADATDAATLRQNVTSKGGVTAAALDVLMAEGSGLPALMQDAVSAARKRSEELGA